MDRFVSRGRRYLSPQCDPPMAEGRRGDSYAKPPAANDVVGPYRSPATRSANSTLRRRACARRAPAAVHAPPPVLVIRALGTPCRCAGAQTEDS